MHGRLFTGALHRTARRVRYIDGIGRKAGQ
jgi:hypothetical protein